MKESFLKTKVQKFLSLQNLRKLAVSENFSFTVTGGKKNGCEGVDHVMLVGAYPRIQTVQECAWTNLQEEYRSWKGVDFRSFREGGIAQGRYLPSVTMRGDKKKRKKKDRKRTTSSKDARKEEEPACQDHL